MMLFDARLTLGRDAGLEEFQFSDVESIRRTLDKYRIKRALLSTFASYRFDVAYGNRLAFETAEQDERLIPCPAVVPNSAGEVGDEAAFVADLIGRGARCVGFYPKSCGVSLAEGIVGPLLKAAEARRLPVQIPSGEAGLPAMVSLAERHPGVPFIYCPYPAPLYRDRNWLALLASVPNVYLTINAPFAPNEGIERACERLGSGRLLFASNYPVNEPGVAVSYLLYSALSEEDVARVAFKNLEGLINGING